MYASVCRVTPATLPEVGVNAVKLPPANYHLVAIGRINRDGGLIRCVAQYVVAASIDVHLKAGEESELRDLSRRSFYLARWRRRHVVFFEGFVQRQPS